MSEIDRYRAFDGGLSRRTSRGLSQIQSGSSLAIARVEARTDIQAAQVDAVAAVAQRAMQGIAFVSQVEQQLGQVVPLAVTRLQAIGDLAALGMGQVLADTVHQVRGR